GSELVSVLDRGDRLLADQVDDRLAETEDHDREDMVAAGELAARGRGAPPGDVDGKIRVFCRRVGGDGRTPAERRASGPPRGRPTGRGWNAPRWWRGYSIF